MNNHVCYIAKIVVYLYLPQHKCILTHNVSKQTNLYNGRSSIIQPHEGRGRQLIIWQIFCRKSERGRPVPSAPRIRQCFISKNFYLHPFCASRWKVKTPCVCFCPDCFTECRLEWLLVSVIHVQNGVKQV